MRTRADAAGAIWSQQAPAFAHAGTVLGEPLVFTVKPGHELLDRHRATGGILQSGQDAARLRCWFLRG